MERKKYPIGAEHYTLYEEVGQGVSASVHRALCKPLNEIVAIKILDFERSNSDLNNISREAQIMNLVDHPNILKSNCSFVSDHSLWVVMPYMAGGSCLHILKSSHANGFEEVVIATILRETLKGLEYLHSHGLIHRDVKAGNILLDARGHIKLGDLGVSACLFDSGDRQRTRNTFVGTPCWMAPEVMEQLHGYDFKADIWSFGITALELAHGHAPFSRYPPMKVLLMTLQNAPPGLDYERDKKFSKSFREIIASCLVKEPSKRPSSKKLLKYSFFKQARSSDYLARTLLEGLPALGDRIKALKIKEEDMLAQKKIPDGQMEEMSQNEYKRGISSWNFDLEDVKAQAALIQDGCDTSSDGNQGCNSASSSPLNVPENEAMLNQSAHPPLIDSASNEAKVRCDKSDDECKAASSCYEQHIQKSSPPRDHYAINEGEKPNTESSKGILDSTGNQGHRKENSQEASIPPSKGESIAGPQAIDCLLSEVPLKAAKTLASQSEELDEKAKAPVVQQKGRFKVTSENVELEKVTPSPVLQKSHSMQVISSQHTPVPVPSTTSPIVPDLTPTPSNSVFQALQSLLQANIVQRDNILSLMNQLANGDTTGGLTAAMEKSMLEVAHDREKDLLNEVSDLQWRLICAQGELQKQKTDSNEVRN